ncbi:MAG: NAD(P)/FAD-dependent oxidoreductase [Dehalococcoidia bacterium]
MNSELFDTIVIGAGPVGSYAAQLLAGGGFNVAIMEEHEHFGEPMQCTGIIGVECFERFHLSTESVLREARSAKLFSPSGRLIRLHSERPQTYIVDRSAFDRMLADSAASHGAKYFTSNKVTGIEITSDRVRLSIDKGKTFESRTAIIASGFYSKLTQKLGLEKYRDFITGAQAEVTIKESSELEEIEIYFDQDLAPGFFAWLVPTSPQRALAGLFSRKAPKKHLSRFLQTLYDRGRITSSEVEITHGAIPLKPLNKTYYERVIVAGDAAGQVKPTSGGGVYYGMICAQIASDVLRTAFAENDFSEGSLSAYQKEWQKEIGQELRNGYIARRIYEKLSNRLIDNLFGLSLKKGLHEIINESEDISFDWHGRAFSEFIRNSVPRIFKS